jgi:hypothetical protein
MGCGDITAMASSGILCTNCGVFLEQEVATIAATNIRATKNLFIREKFGLNSRLKIQYIYNRCLAMVQFLSRVVYEKKSPGLYGAWFFMVGPGILSERS